MCSRKILGSVGSVDSLITLAHFHMSLQPTGQPGITRIQELMHVTPMLAFTLNHGTLEDVDTTVVNIFDIGNRGEEHIDR